MISYSDIRNSYDKLYIAMRKYIWGFPIVTLLADIEIASYQTCPDVPVLRSLLYNLAGAVREISAEDPELKKALDEFNELLSESDAAYAKLYKVNEVIQNEDDKGSETEGSSF